MALTALSTKTNVICEEMGWMPPVTVRTTGTDLKPGMVVTFSGETVGVGDVDLPGTGEYTAGILGLLDGADIDAANADNTSVPLHPRGSGAKVWTWALANCGDIVAMQPLIFTTAGYVTVIATPDEPATWNEATSQAELDKLDVRMKTYVGVAARGSANDASNDRPILVWLI